MRAAVDRLRDIIAELDWREAANVVASAAAVLALTACAVVAAMVGRRLDADEIEAVRSYAAEHGRRWKEALSLDWYNARVVGRRGSILHGMRNDPNLGPRWLESFRLSDLDP